MYSSQLLSAALLATFNQAFFAQGASVTIPSNKTAISPDGYKYIIEDEPYVPQTITHPDGTMSQVLLHPSLASWAPPNRSFSSDQRMRLSWQPTGHNEDTCGPATFEKRTTGGSPLVSDCAKIRDYYRNPNGGYYQASWGTDLRLNGDWTRLVITDSCTFGVRGDGYTCALRVGNTDIADLVGDAINQFQDGDRVGGEGRMSCVDGCKTENMAAALWAVFHT